MGFDASASTRGMRCQGSLRPVAGAGHHRRDGSRSTSRRRRYRGHAMIMSSELPRPGALCRRENDIIEENYSEPLQFEALLG